jgi:hypothetical protein
VDLKHSGYLLVLLGALALSGCEKKETTVVPVPSGPSSTVTKEKETVMVPGPKETVVVPGPKGEPGPQGPTGATGAPGEPGKSGNTTVIVPPPSK